MRRGVKSCSPAIGDIKTRPTNRRLLADSSISDAPTKQTFNTNCAANLDVGSSRKQPPTAPGLYLGIFTSPATVSADNGSPCRYPFQDGGKALCMAIGRRWRLAISIICWRMASRQPTRGR